MVTGTGTRAGHSRSHSMIASKRTFKPNLIRKVIRDEDGKPMPITILARYYKKLIIGEKVRIPAGLTPAARKKAEYIVRYFTA